MTAVTFAALAAPALANAPNPIPGTTKLDSALYSSNGSVTVTIEGQWNWVTQTDCPTARNGVGYQVDWFDGNTANPIGGAKSPDGVIYVGGPVFPGGPNDNIVHSVETSRSNYNPVGYWSGVPTSYTDHVATSAQPTKTDAANWYSNCANENSTTKISSGSWGPISHTYPAGTTSITVCPVMYDPHGGSDDSGKSAVGDITAGGSSHNGDNSYEGNGQGTNGNNCLQSSITLPPPNNPNNPNNPNQPASNTLSPGFTVRKEQKIGTGSFTTGTLTSTVGKVVQYEIIVTNTGNTALTFSNFSDSHCEGISGGPGSTPVQPGDSTTYACDHRLTKADLKAGSHSNVASVSAAGMRKSSNRVVVNLGRVRAKKISRKPKIRTGFTG